MPEELAPPPTGDEPIVTFLSHFHYNRFCQNKTCGRVFVRQQRTGKRVWDRTKGVLYCSPQCTNAQANRELRRRKAASDRPTG